jgi:hypothetical protein
MGFLSECNKLIFVVHIKNYVSRSLHLIGSCDAVRISPG